MNSDEPCIHCHTGCIMCYQEKLKAQRVQLITAADVVDSMGDNPYDFIIRNPHKAAALVLDLARALKKAAPVS